MDAKHTSGPWHVVRYGDGDSLVVCTDLQGNHRIAFLSVPGSRILNERTAIWREIRANAHLIAAAPNLLAQCEAMVPARVCLTNPNVQDSTIVPLEVTMGELRALAGVIALAKGSAK